MPVSDETAADHRVLPGSEPSSQASVRYSLRWLARLLMILVAVEAAAWLGAIALPVLAAAGEVASIMSLVTFVVWFYRARVNADGHGWRQRWSAGWAIGAWFIPVLDLYCRFQIMADIWRAGLPPPAWRKRAVLPGTWWACFVLQPIVTGQAHPVKVGPLTFYAGISVYGRVIVMVAAIMTVLVVQKVSGGPLGRTQDSSSRPPAF